MQTKGLLRRGEVVGLEGFGLAGGVLTDHEELVVVGEEDEAEVVKVAAHLRGVSKSGEGCACGFDFDGAALRALGEDAA